LYQLFKEDPQSNPTQREYSFMTIGPASPLSFSEILLFFLAMQYPDEFIKENLQFFNPKTPRQSKSYLLLLLQTPIADYRKNAVALVLAPYLIGISRALHEIEKAIERNY
jgi:hypothetical protein